MITIERAGFYKLIETRENTKILYLDGDSYAWIEPKSIGEILIVTHKHHRADDMLSIGHYRIYNVIDEPNLSDMQHLELEFGKKAWQGYLLLTGLPDDHKKRARIIPTTQTITGNPHFKDKISPEKPMTTSRRKNASQTLASNKK